MRPEHPTAALVIGVGNLYRRDDGAGLVIADRLKARQSPDIIVREENGEGASLMEMWQRATAVIIVDAVQSGGRAGTIHRFDAIRQRIPGHFFHYSTHAFGVAEAVELARALKHLPSRLVIYGIEGRDFRSGKGLSAPVKTAVKNAVSQILSELDAIRKETSR